MDIDIKHLNVRIPKDLMHRIKIRCTKNNEFIADWIILVLEQELKRENAA